LYFNTLIRYGFLTAAITLAWVSDAKAVAIPLFGTGTNANNVVQPAGTPDPHYTVSYGPPSVTGPAVVDSFHGDPDPGGAWVADQPNAAWISVANAIEGLPAGVQIGYTTTFDLTGLDPATVSISIRWAVDDSGTGVFLNGVQIPGSAVPRNGSGPTTEPWAHFTALTLDSQHQTFLPGKNTLAFVQDASDGVVDGVIVQISGTATPFAVTLPQINPGGIVPIYSLSTTIQPGSWISIYGTNLASAPATWNGDFPKTLGGTSVNINNKAAYLWYVSPGQLNVQAPDDPATGPVSVEVTTANGKATGSVTLASVNPSFSLLDAQHVAGIILRLDGTGAFGSGPGSYDVIGPTGRTLGFQTHAVKAGDIISLFGVGFGPTDPPVPAGQVISVQGGAKLTNPVTVLIGNAPVTPSFAGLTQAGLYQLNLTVPAGIGSGELALVAQTGGVQTQASVILSAE
jgi:uncharacterized protein (TIGR03437 family)